MATGDCRHFCHRHHRRRRNASRSSLSPSFFPNTLATPILKRPPPRAALSLPPSAAATATATAAGLLLLRFASSSSCAAAPVAPAFLFGPRPPSFAGRGAPPYPTARVAAPPVFFFGAPGMTTLRRSTRVAAAASSSSKGADDAEREAGEGSEPSPPKDMSSNDAEEEEEDATGKEEPSPTPKRKRATTPKSKKAASKKRKTPPPKKKKAGSGGKAGEPSDTDGDEEVDVGSSEAGSESEDDNGAGGDGSSERKKKTAKKKTSKARKKKKAPDHQRQTERDELTKLWDGKKAMAERGCYTFKIISWNVAGLRAVLKNRPSALPDLVSNHKPDLICLQETKLQEAHVDDPKLKLQGHLLEEEGYDSYYSCATVKKGYSGTAVFVKRRTKPAATTDATPDRADSKSGGKKKKKQAKLGSFFQSASSKQDDDENGTDGADKVDENFDPDDSTGDVDVSNLIPQTVSFGLNKAQHDGEGRTITVDYPLFTLTNVYVPNSGQKLDRLAYRTDSWDVDLAEYMNAKASECDRPVIWCGDLNVARGALETWNEGAKHLAKSAGTTPQERASFEAQLDDGRYIDAFGELHKNKKGWYTYWSQRAGNRAPNKGLRLDYFICSSGLFSKRGTKKGGEGNSDEVRGKVIVRDSYMLPDQEGSDHCPIVLELEIKK